MSTHAAVAIFDLDHTLAQRDTFLLYLCGFLWRHPWRISRCIPLPFSLFLFFMGLMNNTRLKECFLRAVLGGVSRSTLEQWSGIFLDRLISRWLSKEGLNVLEEHRRAGDRLILLTASPDCYVVQLGARLKFDEVICTQVEWDKDKLTGNLLGPNMHGEQKAKAVLSIRERFRGSILVAYADSYSDLSMLRLADRGVLVNGKSSARLVATLDALETCAWNR